MVQDYVLPTVAYVGGPAELAYMAQSQVLYRDLLGRMPVMVSRGGFTLLDARTAKLMDRYGLNSRGVFPRRRRVRDAIAQKLVPPALTEEFSRVNRTVSQVHGAVAAPIWWDSMPHSPRRPGRAGRKFHLPAFEDGAQDGARNAESQ